MHYEVRVTKFNKCALTQVNDDGTTKRLMSTETDGNGARHVANLLNEYQERVAALEEIIVAFSKREKA